MDEVDWSRMYERLMERIVGYSVGLCAAVRKIGGDKLLRKVIKEAARNSALTIKLERVQGTANPQEALGHVLETMLADFQTKGIVSTNAEDSYNVDNSQCGCLPPFIEAAVRYCFTPEEARYYACTRCMPSYKGATELSGLEFRGKWTERGCVMQFINSK